MVMLGVAGTVAGVGLAVVRERFDRISDARAAKQAAEESESEDTNESDSAEIDSDKVS